MGRQYIVKKVLNNNVILAIDKEKGQELILIGKGIGFSKKEDYIIRLKEDDIEKSFLAFDNKEKREYYQLINQVDERVIGISEEIIAMAEKEFGTLNSHIHIALTDHISFALERINSGLEISNPFLYEIKVLYSDEFRIGERAATMINEELGINISESEMGFIALHIHSARQFKKVGQTIKDTQMLINLVNIIQEELSITIDNSGLAYNRLITHLRASINRVEEHKYITNPLLDKIKEEFVESYEIAKKIGDYFQEHRGICVPDDELGYLALHIERLKEM